ncbi:MAG: GTP 3',8-cyclase MoaA [Sedimentisphaerales bacterium]
MHVDVDYLRISVTDRCNLRCIYCNPLGRCDFIEHKEILRFEEIYRIVRLFVECGIRKVRLTGGEPLVRRNIVQLVQTLAAIPLDDLALTTNGVLLERMAEELKAAGLKRVNISVDSAERESYRQITGFDLLPKVTKGIYKAIKVGLMPVKTNSVIIRDINVCQILSLAQMSIYLPVMVRFIEYCPACKHTKPAKYYVPNSEVREIIERKFGPLSNLLAGGTNGPALYFKIRNSAGAIGFINGRSSVFCHSCNRLRLTSDGKLKPCLYSAHHYDLKKLIRSDATDGQILALLKKIIAEKSRFTKLNSFRDEFSMRKVGG